MLLFKARKVRLVSQKGVYQSINLVDYGVEKASLKQEHAFNNPADCGDLSPLVTSPASPQNRKDSL